MATAAVWESQPPSQREVAELRVLHDANGQVLWSKTSTPSAFTKEVVPSPTGGFLFLGPAIGVNALNLSWNHPDGVQQWSLTIPNCNGATIHGPAARRRRVLRRREVTADSMT